MHRDPVCGRRMNPNKAYAKVKHDGAIYLLCCPVCQEAFQRNPEMYTTEGGRATGGVSAPRAERRHEGPRRHRNPSG